MLAPGADRSHFPGSPLWRILILLWTKFLKKKKKVKNLKLSIIVWLPWFAGIQYIFFECLTRRESGGWVKSLRRGLRALDSSRPASGPRGQQNKDISSLEGEVSSRTKNWCFVLSVIVMGCWWEEQKQESFSRLNFPSHSFNFYLWPGLAVHVFPILLLSSWENPSSSSFSDLSASVNNLEILWWNCKMVKH